MGVLTNFPHRARIGVKVIHEKLCGCGRSMIAPTFLEKGVNMIHAREMLEHPVITEMERWGEIRVRYPLRRLRRHLPQGGRSRSPFGGAGERSETERV